jgi:hypothetical protein
MRQFIAVEFKQGSRCYTYHNDGERLATGDVVRVPMRHGGSQRATVFGEVDQPEFETKPILEKIEDGGLLNSIGENKHGHE